MRSASAAYIFVPLLIFFPINVKSMTATSFHVCSQFPKSFVVGGEIFADNIGAEIPMFYFEQGFLNGLSEQPSGGIEVGYSSSSVGSSICKTVPKEPAKQQADKGTERKISWFKNEHDRGYFHGFLTGLLMVAFVVFVINEFIS